MITNTAFTSFAQIVLPKNGLFKSNTFDYG
jgi:hypothetical protein